MLYKKIFFCFLFKTPVLYGLTKTQVVRSEIKLMDLNPVIKMTDFIEEPLYFSNVITGYSRYAYILGNLLFYLGVVFSVDFANFQFKNTASKFFILGLFVHFFVSILSFFLQYFKFRAIFGIVANGAAFGILICGVSDFIPLEHTKTFYFSAIVFQTLLNIILFLPTNSRRTITIDIKEMVEELQDKNMGGEALALI